MNKIEIYICVETLTNRYSNEVFSSEVKLPWVYKYRI